MSRLHLSNFDFELLEESTREVTSETAGHLLEHDLGISTEGRKAAKLDRRSRVVI